MAYSLRYRDGGVYEYLSSCERFSRQARVKLFTLLRLHLGEYGDELRNDPIRRLRPGSDCFQLDLLFEDPDEVERLHHFRFIVSDRSAQYGVLRVLFVERLSS